MISDRLKAVILAELKLPDFPLHEATTAPQVPGWDSLKHVAILAAVEKEFGLRFKTLDIVRLKNVGDLQAAVDRKLAAK